MNFKKLKKLTFKTSFLISVCIVVVTLVLSSVIANRLFPSSSEGLENNQEVNYSRSREILDPSLIDLSKGRQKKETRKNIEVRGNSSGLTVNEQKPELVFNKNGNGNSRHEVSLTPKDHKESLPLETNGDIKFENIYDWVDLEVSSYDDATRQTYILESDAASRNINVQITKSQNIELINSDGNHVIIKDKNSDDDLFIVKQPQGLDAENHRIDFKFEINDSDIKFMPSREWQFDFAVYPVKIFVDIISLEWYEALVQVGKSCDNPGCGEDGDIIDIKPAGWNWGVEERTRFVVVKISKQNSSTLEEILSRTVKQEDIEVDESNPGIKVKKYPENSPRLNAIANLVRYGINYTELATEDQIDTIRDTAKESPILDGINKPVIKKKNNPIASVIPSEKKLDYLAEKPKNEGLLGKFWSSFIKPASAATTVTSTIGSAGGRTYSTLQAWETAKQGNLVGLDQVQIGEAYEDSSFTSATTYVVVISGSTTDSTRYMKLTVATASRHNGLINTGAVIDCAAARGGIEINDDYTVVEWIEVKNQTGSSGRAGIFIDGDDDATAATGIIIQYVLIHSFNDASFTVIGIRTASSPGVAIDGTIRNSIFLSGDSAAVRIYNATDTFNFYNNTVYDMSGDGFLTGGGTHTFTNNISINPNNGSSTDFDLTGTITQSYNVVSDTSASGTGTLQSKTAANNFTTPSGTIDIHLISTADAKDVGTTIGSITDDFDGNSRPQGSNYDIGADEYISPITYTQSAYRWITNADNTTGGAALAALNTAYSATSTSQQFRLRMLIHVAGAQLNSSAQDFKLQFAGKGAGSCASPSGTPSSYTDVTSGTAISYYNNATPADAASLSANGSDPTHSSDTIVNQTYEEANNFTNSVAAIPAGQDGKWDFSLYDNAATSNTTYCIRVVTSTGTVLGTYTAYPEITTYNPPAGLTVDQITRHGGGILNGVKFPYSF
jgi:hypothetical protein